MQGSNGLAQAYRRRRMAAVVLCLWRATATGLARAGRGAQVAAAVVEASEEAGEGDDASSDSGESSVSELAWELEE